MFRYVIMKNIYVELLEKENTENSSICTLLFPKKMLLGYFKGNEEDAIFFVQYLKQKYISVATIYGKYCRIDDVKNSEKSPEELLLKITHVEKKENKKVKKKREIILYSNVIKIVL